MDGRTDGAVQEQQEQQQQSRLKRREKKEKGIVLGKVERSSDQNLLRSGPVRSGCGLSSLHWSEKKCFFVTDTTIKTNVVH